ncbi:MAG: InlB B-repeat-containing protein, partial [Clostridia bacterium]|nr:InlB B-repeat-containing protein [Clostridia bacterium]
IRYRVDGKIDSTKSVDVAIGDTITIPEAVEKSGYTFKGWRNSGKTYQPGDTLTVSKDYTFDASFEKINPTNDSDISLNKKYDIEIDKGSKVHITVTVTNVPDGYHFWLYQNGEGVIGGPVTGGTSTIDWTSEKINEDSKFTLKLIDSSGTVAKNETRPLMSTINVKVKTGFFARLIAFFKNLFGLLPTIEIK